MNAHDVVADVVRDFNKIAEFHAEGLFCPIEALREMLYAVADGLDKLGNECPNCAVKGAKTCRECEEHKRQRQLENY